MFRKLHESAERAIGPYVPGSTNFLLLTVQVLFAVQGAARGEDYVFPRPPGDPVSPSLSEIERAFPLPVWGAGFLLGAGAVIMGLILGRLSAIVVGHSILSALYVAFALGLMSNAPIYNIWMAIAGAIVLTVGMVSGLMRRPGNELGRVVVAILLVGIGGWVCGFGLGYDFRTASGLTIAALVHGAFAIGMVWIASRAPGREVKA